MTNLFLQFLVCQVLICIFLFGIQLRSTKINSDAKITFHKQFLILAFLRSFEKTTATAKCQSLIVSDR